MSLTPGTRLGPYEILSLLGSGGMGEVYRAKDTRLDREVAIKVLPMAVADDRALRERFGREARVISSLSHAHICPLFDVGEHEGAPFLVMELLDGDTLEARLVKGALPLDAALSLAIQVLSALEAAHRAGIVHRDLKPGNIMLTKSGAKLLDFGLARTNAPAVVVSGTMVPTTPPTITAHGTILGTFQYMAPEQIEGLEVDGRTDIFAFGCLLFEMLSGRKAFEGKTRASLLGAILKDVPAPVSSVTPLAPTSLDRVVSRCLEKAPDDRWQTARDLRAELQWVQEGSVSGNPSESVPVTPKARMLEYALAIALAIALAAAIAWNARPRDRGGFPPVQFVVVPPDGTTWPSGGGAPYYAISPDGQRIVFVAENRAGIEQVWVRSLSSAVPQLLRGTEQGTFPFWSPDSQRIGFFAEGKLRLVDVSGGPPETLCETHAEGGTWSRSGVLLLSQWNTALFRSSVTDRSCTPVSTLDTASGEREQLWPQFLPDGEHFFYLARFNDPAQTAIYATKLGSHDRQLVVKTDYRATFAPPDHLLFVRDGTLVVQPFDVSRLRLEGNAVPIAANMSLNPNGRSNMSASDDGVLVYRGSTRLNAERLTWFDRGGREIGIVGDSAFYSTIDLSPDGKRIVADWRDPNMEKWDVAIVDVSTGVASRLTVQTGPNPSPIWTPDGLGIVFRASDGELREKRLDANGDERTLVKSTGTVNPTGWSPDGQALLYRDSRRDGVSNDVWELRAAADRQPRLLLRTPDFSGKGGARVSPDGRWLAYTSNETGTTEVFVRTYPPTNARWQISTHGGQAPQWSRRGSELFFRALDNMLMAVPVTIAPDGFSAGTPTPLFRLPDIGFATRNHWVVTDDGRILVVKPPEAVAPPLTVVLNWPASLKK